MLWEEKFGPDGPTVVLAAYGIPGVIGIATLLGMGLRPEFIRVLTYPRDPTNSPLLDSASNSGIEFVTTRFSEPATLEWLRACKINALFSLHYRDRIPSAALSLPSHGSVNLHPSLLPDYKGCFSVPWVIINQEPDTGFTWHYMDEDFDSGTILVQERMKILPNDTAYSLFHRQVIRGMGMFESVVERVLLTNDRGMPQSSTVRYFPRQLPFDGKIDPAWSEDRIERFIRAMYFPPHRGAVFEAEGQELEILNLKQYQQLIAGSS